MHKLNIAHRDIKPENILIDGFNGTQINVKFTDFGFATYFNDQDKLKEQMGSPLYMAPEIVKGHLYDQQVDIWSTCIVIYTMLTGRPAFYGSTKDEIYRAIRDDEIEFGLEFRNISKEAIDFLKKGLHKNQFKRHNCSQMLNHKWFTNENKSSMLDKSNQSLTHIS